MKSPQTAATFAISRPRSGWPSLALCVALSLQFQGARAEVLEPGVDEPDVALLAALDSADAPAASVEGEGSAGADASLRARMDAALARSWPASPEASSLLASDGIASSDFDLLGSAPSEAAAGADLASALSRRGSFDVQITLGGGSRDPSERKGPMQQISSVIENGLRHVHPHEGPSFGDRGGDDNPALAVPEPSEYALIALGCGFVAFLARRRLRAAAVQQAVTLPA